MELAYVSKTIVKMFFYIKCMVLDTYALLLTTYNQSINLVLTESRSGEVYTMQH